MPVELVLARNPDPDSALPYLLRLPLGEGLLFATRDVWPRTSGLYCHPLPLERWPEDPQDVQRIPLRSCTRRGAAIDVVADRGRENRSQLVFTWARGRQMVFWQSPRTRKQARPQVRTPSARAAGIAHLEIVVDAHERYPYTFGTQQVRTVRRGLAAGDYAVLHQGRTVAAVERKSMEDLISSLSSGRLRFALADLAALPRAAVIVEAGYAKIFAQERVRPSLVADGVAELQVRWPCVPIVFAENRKLAEEWTYRWLAAALTWAGEEDPAVVRVGSDEGQLRLGEVPEPSSREIRRWAQAEGLPVSDRGRLRPEIVAAWHRAHDAGPG